MTLSSTFSGAYATGNVTRKVCVFDLSDWQFRIEKIQDGEKVWVSFGEYEAQTVFEPRIDYGDNTWSFRFNVDEIIRMLEEKVGGFTDGWM